MKRILTAILCAGILAVTAAGCSYNDALYKDSNSSSQNGEDSTQPTTSSVSDQKYSDNLDGLVDYFVAKQYIDNKDNSIKMDASAIIRFSTLLRLTVHSVSTDFRALQPTFLTTGTIL